MCLHFPLEVLDNDPLQALDVLMQACSISIVVVVCRRTRRGLREVGRKREEGAVKARPRPWAYLLSAPAVCPPSSLST
jgi:hypothetical protein